MSWDSKHMGLQNGHKFNQIWELDMAIEMCTTILIVSRVHTSLA